LQVTGLEKSFILEVCYSQVSLYGMREVGGSVSRLLTSKQSQ
jgi:hypothetical protein